MDKLTGRQITDALDGSGWRFVLRTLTTSVPVRSLAQAVEVAAWLAQVADTDADSSLRMDVRADRLVLTLQSFADVRVTTRELDLARRIAAVAAELGVRLDPAADGSAPRSVQLLELAVDALDIARIRPFWQAVLGYETEPGDSPVDGALVDPGGQGPTVWFQQMDEPRPQRNRIHLDLSVPHDEAPLRIAATLAAGGVLRSDAEAPSFWVLADAEGNEVCVSTWQGRD